MTNRDREELFNKYIFLLRNNNDLKDLVRLLTKY